MIKLLEHEGKAILAACGIPVPEGALFRHMPDGLDGPLVVKAQAPVGGRGKAGGIRFVDGPAAALLTARQMHATTLNGVPIEDVYVERRLDIAAEFYLAALVDRDLGMPVLLASKAGGVDIEEAGREHILRQPVDPLIGLQPFMVDRLARALTLDAAIAPAFAAIVRTLHAALVSQDAELIEINPLVLTRSGHLVAADAKVVLDEDAAFRHPGRRARPQGTAFELAARDLEVIGVETGPKGGIAAIMNGAGLTMATLDEIIALSGPMSGVVELHGAAMNGPERVAEILACVERGLEPSVILVNIHFQFRSLVTIAEGVLHAMQAIGPDRLVLRLRGEQEAEAHAALADHGFAVFRDFAPACQAAVDRSRG